MASFNSRQRARRWVFTHQLSRGNRVDKSDEDHGSLIARKGGEELRYCIFQREVAPVTGQVHLQGYLCFNKKMRLSSVLSLKLWGVREHAHLEPARGTQAQCIAYCSKEETRAPNAVPIEVRCFHCGYTCPQLQMYVQIGTKPQQGKRNDVPDVVEFLTAHPLSSWTEVALAEPRVANMMRLVKRQPVPFYVIN